MALQAKPGLGSFDQESWHVIIGPNTCDQSMARTVCLSVTLLRKKYMLHCRIMCIFIFCAVQLSKHNKKMGR